MEFESSHPKQELSIDNAQRAVSQTVQRVAIDNIRGEGTGSIEQRTACRTADDARQLCASGTSIIAECEALCSKSTEVDVRNPAGDEMLNAQDFQESRTTWQDDEHQYKTQMSLLNKEWSRPEVNEIMAKLRKGDLPFAEAANRISVILRHEVTVSSVRNRALHYFGSSQSGNNHREHKSYIPNEENTLEKHAVTAKKFGPEFYEIIRNLRGNFNNIAIKEPRSNSVRIYRRSTTRYYYSYYRCSTCDHMSRREVDDYHPSPIIKMVHDSIVGEPFPLHHPECKPISLSQLRAMQIDRENRQEVINEMMTPFEAWSKGDLRALLEEARKVSQHAEHRPRWKKIKYKSQHQDERHPYARPLGETLVSYEEKIRRKLNGQLKRPDSRTSSVVSEQFGAQTPTNEEESFAQQGQDESTFMTDGSQSHENRLISEKRVHIEQSKISAEGTLELSTGKSSFASRESSERVDDFSGINQSVLGDETPGSEIGTESDTNTTFTGMSRACSSSDRSNLVTMLDDGKQDIVRETNRKLFMVDDEHLLKLFRRCPDCGERLISLSLSSRKAVPLVTYKCQGNCEERIWFGYEPK